MLKEIRNEHNHFFLDENGFYHGEYKLWYPDGQIHRHCYYINGVRNGEYRSWYQNGQQKKHCFYINDIKNGECKWWGENGMCREHCFYIDGSYRLLDEIPYPETAEDRMYFKLKYSVPLLPVKTI